jgi:hypothetical protein
MIVHRNTLHVQQGKMMEALDLVKQAFAIAPPPGVFRIYTDFVGQTNMMAIETEYAGLAEYQSSYEAMFTNENLAGIGAEFSMLVTGRGKNEIWHVHN